MKKVKLLLAAALSMIAWTGTMAQTDAEYEAALSAIENNADYYVKSNVGGTDYYLTGSGTLTSIKANAGIFTFQKTSGGGYKQYGFLLDNLGTKFSNPPGTNESNLASGKINTSTNKRADYETQVFFLKDGKYAVRACNTATATSGWNWVGGSYWTVVGDVNPVAQYQWAANYCWELEGPVAAVKVTYKLVESNGTTEVSSTTRKHEANSAITPHLPGTGMDFNGNFHENFCYDYDVSGTIGDTDCTITIKRTEKPGVVKALSDLSNTKAYNIGCDRGAMIAFDGKMVNTALNNAAANAQPYGKFALINYENNYYIFSIDEGKFIKNDASVALDLTTVGFSTEDAMVMEAQADKVPYFLWHFNAASKYLNTNGNAPLGYVINAYSSPDEGNLYYMIAVDDFDPTAALAELNAYFHPSYFVTYIVKDEFGNTLFTSEKQPAKLGAKITSLLDEFKRPFYTYNDVDVTISEENTTVEFTATWNGPFKLSENFDNAQWQNMAVRGSYYVTSGNAASDKSLAPIPANAVGLVEDAYQWAFVGSGYAGFKLFNKAKGADQVYAWVSNDNASVPTFVDVATANVWTIKASTSAISNAFMLTTDMGYQVNQFGGATGSLKIWQSTGTGDAGSAFTIFDVPTNFAEFLVNEGIPAYFEPTGYFTFTDAAKTALGWDPAYKTDCPFEAYKNLKDNLAALDMSDLSQFILPETGYYLLKNKYYGTYMGIDPSDANMYGNYKEEVVPQPKHIVKLTKNGTTYSISLMGKFAPATVEQSQPVTAATDETFYTPVVSVVGYAAFQADPAANMSCLHTRAAGDIVGWEAPAAASMWEVIDAEGEYIDLTVGETGYATAYLPFPVAIPKGVTAYTAKIAEEADYQYLELNPVETTIPALTAVILKADANTYEFMVGEVPADGMKIYEDEVDGSNALVKGFAETLEENVLKGTLEPIDAVGKYVLAKPEGEEKVAFYLAESGKIAAGKAYLELPETVDVKAFYFLLPGEDPTGIANVETVIENGTIYNVAGQRIQKMQRGINIVNGKKVAVK